MSNVAHSPTAGRFKTRQSFLHNTAVDFTAGAADIVAFPVVLDKIKIIGIGYVTVAASTTVTTTPEMRLDKTLAGTSTQAQVGTVEATLASNVAINTQVFFDFDAGSALSATTGLRSAEAYPTAVKGDLLTLKRTVAGVGGTQSLKPFLIYEEMPV